MAQETILKAVQIAVAEAAAYTDSYVTAHLPAVLPDLYLGPQRGLAVVDPTNATSFYYDPDTTTLSTIAFQSWNTHALATLSGVTDYTVGDAVFVIFTATSNPGGNTPWAATNGPYVITVLGDGSHNGEMVRALNFDNTNDLRAGQYATIEEGLYQDYLTVLNNEGTLDSDPLSFIGVGGRTSGALPTATDVGQVPRSTGVGTSYTASPLTLQGTLAGRPTATAARSGVTYTATDQFPPQTFRCVQTGVSSFAWYLEATGSSAANARAVIGAGTSSVALASTNPSALGSPSAGSGSTASRVDHVHQIPTASQVGAIATTALSDTLPLAPGTPASGVSTSVSRADHVHTPTTPGQVGLGLVTATGPDATSARAVIGAAAATTTLTAGSGLTGGGDLSASRSFTVDTTLIATRAYAESLATASGAGLDVKLSVHTTALSNVSGTYANTGGPSGRGQLTGMPTTVGGRSLAANFRVGLIGQTSGAENGIWTVSTLGTGSNGVWNRASDFDSDAEVTNGAFFFTTGGDQEGYGYVLITPDPIVIGGASGTALVFTQFSGGAPLSTATPQALGSASAGSTGEAADAGHVHPTTGLLTTAALSNASPSALGTASAGVSTSVSRADHVHSSSVQASNISDSSSSGRSVLTGTPAQARTSLGLSDLPHYIPLLSCAVRVDLTSLVLVGGSPGALDPATLALSGRTLAYTLTLLGSVSAPGLTGEVTVVDSTATTVATINVTATTDTSYTTSITVPGASRSYLLQARLTTSSGPTDYLTLSGAAIRATWS
jgi:hypothetical protein